MSRFTDSRVIVTGAGQGIGLTIAEQFAADGADVMLISRTVASLEAAEAKIKSSGGKAWPFQTDVSKMHDVQAAVRAAIDRWGRVDVLVNNAGIDDETPFLEISEASWNAVIGTNLTGPFFMSQQVCREMARLEGGVVIHIASIDAFGGDGAFASYNSAKAGLLGLNARSRKRSAGTEIENAATTTPSSTTGAAAQHTPAWNSCSSIAQPFARICSSSAWSNSWSTIVRGVTCLSGWAAR